MKTPEEFKKGLSCQYGEELPCRQCSYTISWCRAETAKDAIAYIQQLEAQVPKWISVKERLPENEERVLFFAKEPRLTIDTAYGWWVNITNRYKVTHWMPLPEPPKEG